MPTAPSRTPLTPVVTAVAVLGVLAFARWHLTHRAVVPAPAAVSAPAPRLDDGAYVQTIAPLLRLAGCAAVACHGSPNTPGFALSPTVPGTASGMLTELAAVRLRVRAGDLAGSPLYQAAVAPRHPPGAGAGVGLDPAGCAATQLGRWIRGVAVARCTAP